MTTDAVVKTRLPLPLLHRGKVRDVYEAPGDRLLLVATDRVSAFDVVMDEPVPGKGRVLTGMTAWWLATHFRDEPHHLLSVEADDILRAAPALANCRNQWEGRATLARRTRPVPVECVVRGHLSGSAWREYSESGTLAGEPLPPGLEESGPLPRPLFSPATKAREGHDENIAFDRVAQLLGTTLANQLRERSLSLFERGRDAAAAAGIIVADTKFEFGATAEGELLLIDEVLTPDSSRFWPADRYAPGRSQPSMDKQPIRDYLAALPNWDRQAPPPPLPTAATDAAAKRYRDVFRRLAGAATGQPKVPAPA